MKTIDIAQAINDNSANVSQNLDPSVLGGLIGIDDSWMRWRSQLNTDLDLNALITNGLYQILSLHTGLNKPPIQGILEVFGKENNMVVQRVTSFVEEKMCYRVMSSNGSWTDWKTI